MIRRQLVPQDDGTVLILVQGALRVELHDLDGNIIEGRDTTQAERDDDAAMAATLPRGSTDRLTGPAAKVKAVAAKAK